MSRSHASHKRRQPASTRARFGMGSAIASGVVLGALAMTVSACNEPKHDPHAFETLQKVAPMLDDGDLYFSYEGDGKCTATDCPPPGLRRAWVVECSHVDADVDTLRAALVANGLVEHQADSFTGSAGEYTATIEGVKITMQILTYTNAAEGSQPNLEPYASDPDKLINRCAVVIDGRAA